jgi:nucleoside-diphosphate-sugar epimerase
MRVFLTGATGWIGSALVLDLRQAGHEVVGLARSDASAATVEAAGAAALRGSLDDLDVLREGARASDGVVHVGFKHDEAFAGDADGAAAADRRAVNAFGEALTGSGRPLVIASGLGGLMTGRRATETDVPDSEAPGGARSLAERATIAFAERDVRAAVVRFPPSVHGDGDRGFVQRLAGIARERGVSAYVGEGTNHWPAVHRLDAARLLRLAVEDAPAGSVLHGVAEDGVETREIAGAIGRALRLPVTSVPPTDAAKHFGWLGGLFGLDVLASSERTRQLLGWQPRHSALIPDIEAGHYA